MENGISKLVNGTVLWDSENRSAVSDRINSKSLMNEKEGSRIQK